VRTIKDWSKNAAQHEWHVRTLQSLPRAVVASGASNPSRAPPGCACSARPGQFCWERGSPEPRLQPQIVFDNPICEPARVERAY
jgi:hypothetical protein